MRQLLERFPQARAVVAALAMALGVHTGLEVDSLELVTGSVLAWAVLGWLFERVWLNAKDTDGDGVPDFLSAAPKLLPWVRLAAQHGIIDDVEGYIRMRLAARVEADRAHRLGGGTEAGSHPASGQYDAASSRMVDAVRRAAPKMVVAFALGLGASCGAPFVVVPGVCVEKSCTVARLIIERGEAVDVEVLQADIPNGEAFVIVEHGRDQGTAWVLAEDGDVTAGFCVDVLVWSECHASE